MWGLQSKKDRTGSHLPFLATARQRRLPEVERAKSGGKLTTGRRRASAKGATEGQISLTPRLPAHMFTLCSILDNARGAFCIRDQNWLRRMAAGAGFENARRFHEKCILLFRQFHQLIQGVVWNLCILLYTWLKRATVENQGLSRKNVYFCILLHTFHVWPRQVSFGINGLSATDA